MGIRHQKRAIFWERKVDMILTLEGFPVEFLMTPGSTADVKALKMFRFSFEKGSKIYGDGVYNDYCFETDF